MSINIQQGQEECCSCENFRSNFVASCIPHTKAKRFCRHFRAVNFMVQYIFKRHEVRLNQYVLKSIVSKNLVIGVSLVCYKHSKALQCRP